MARERFVGWLWVLAVFGQTAFAQYTPSQASVQATFDRLDRELPQTKDGLTFAEAEAILEKVKKNKVADLKRLNDYDKPLWPFTVGEIGYCFGRALAAQLELRLAGVKPSAIGKVFIAGDMVAEDPANPGTTVRWRFHVTTIVKDPKLNQWWTLDPVVAEGAEAKVMKAADWMRLSRKLFDEKKNTRFYVTDANTVMVDMRVVPAEKTVENGDRIIEIGFRPETKVTRRLVGKDIQETSDFRPIVDADGMGDLKDLDKLAWRASEFGQYKYFINVHDRFFQRDAAKDVYEFHPDRGEDFDFFGIRLVMLFPKTDRHRWYRYTTTSGSYFADLIGQAEETAEQLKLLPVK